MHFPWRQIKDSGILQNQYLKKINLGNLSERVLKKKKLLVENHLCLRNDVITQLIGKNTQASLER